MSQRYSVLQAFKGTGPAEISKVALQALMYVLIARTLGPTNLGRYAATMAVIAFVTPLVGFGSPHWLLRQSRYLNTIRNNLFWSSSLLTVSTSIIGILFCSVLSATILSVPYQAALMLATAELAIASLGIVLAFQMLAQARSSSYALTTAAPSLARALGAIVFCSPHFAPTLTTWAAFYLVTTIVAVLVVFARLAPPWESPARVTKEQVIWGSQVAVAQLSQGATNDVDKPVLTAFGDVEATGQYAAAYKLLNLCYVIAKAVETAAYPEFFKAGKLGRRSTDRVLRRTATFAIGYGILCIVLGWCFAEAAASLYGRDYGQAATYLRILLFILPFKFLQWFTADALTGLNRQGTRTALQLGSALLSIILLLVLVPLLGVNGAIISTFIVEVLYAVALISVYLRLDRVEETV